MITIPQMMFNSLNSFILVAVPFFILSGEIMARGNVTAPIVNALDHMIGHKRGGLSVVAVLTCMIFAAISGSSAATVVAVGTLMIPEMVKRGYNKRYVLGLLAVAGGLGILIPPSVPMILYGGMTNESVGSLFLAGMVPGILLGLSLIITAVIVFRNDQSQQRESSSWKVRFESMKEAIWGILLPVIILGGIYGGVFTPTEAAAVAVVYAFIIALVVYKGFKLKDTLNILAESAASMSTILLIVAGATLFGYVLTINQIPQHIASYVFQAQLTPIQFLLIVNLFLLVMGMFLETISILLITMPIFLPIIKSLGIDPIHFAIMFIVNMEFALVTPPVGVNLFVASGIGKTPVGEVFKGAIPFFIAMIVNLLLIIFIPQISTWLPGLLKP
jgi:C4-dicarboxylate transporter DctM subunit